MKIFEKYLHWREWQLSTQLNILITSLIVLAVMSITVLSIIRERQTFRSELEQQASSRLGTLLASSVDSLYFLDVDNLAGIIERLTEDPLVNMARFYDSQGRIIVDAHDPTKRSQVTPDPFGQLLIAHDGPVFDWQPDRIVAGQAVRVGNQLIGGASVGLSNEAFNAKIGQVRNQGLAVGLIAIVSGIVIARLFSRDITRPVRDLVQATEHISDGDLTKPIPTYTGSEIGLLGRAMEDMRAELQTLYKGLEQQVVDRTQALTESEERFREVVTSISHHIYVTEFTSSGATRNLYLSPNVAQLTGYSLETIMEDWSFWPTTIIHPDDQAVAAIQAEKFTKREDSQVEYRLIRANGEMIWVLDSGRISGSADKEAFLVYGVVTDITEQKRVQETLARARDQAQEASRLKSEILARVSHELRTPLSAILGYSEMLQEGAFGPLTEEQDKPLETIINSTEFLTVLVNELLDQVQIETGRIQLYVGPFSPADIANSVQAKMTSVVRSKGLDFTLDIDESIPPTMMGDAQRIQQILFNLVGNAVKFTEQGSVQVRLFQSDQEHWALQIKDTGPGIPAHAQHLIFEPFRQVDGSITRSHDGTGLGLSIVQELVNLMGGYIDLESEEGQGSTFTVYLPLQPIQEKIPDSF